MRAGRQISVHTASAKPPEAPCLVSGVAQGATLQGEAEKRGFGILDKGREKQPQCFKTHHTALQAFRTGWVGASRGSLLLRDPKGDANRKRALLSLGHPLLQHLTAHGAKNPSNCFLDIRCRAGKQEKIQGFIYRVSLLKAVPPQSQKEGISPCISKACIQTAVLGQMTSMGQRVGTLLTPSPTQVGYKGSEQELRHVPVTMRPKACCFSR